MTKKRALLLLGGMWHDFDGFAASMRVLLEGAGWEMESSYDLDRLTCLNDQPCDLVFHYTCFVKHAEGLDNSGPEGLNAAQIEGLTRWVRGGGAFLSAHSASGLGESAPGLGELTGGFFLEHPPICTFTVYPVCKSHPIIEGINAFSVYDEMYIEQYDPCVDVHMLAVEGDVAYPLVWSKTEGRGKVAHVALGHSAAVWELAPYRQLMLQTMAWLSGEKM